MGLLADIGLGGIEDALGLGQQPSQYRQPIGPGLLGSPDAAQYTQPSPYVQFGAAQPYVPTFDQYNQDRGSFGGILSNMLRQGTAVGLGESIAPDSLAAQNYNQELGLGQSVYAQGLGLPKQELIAAALRGQIDPSTGLPVPGAQVGIPGAPAPQIRGILANPNAPVGAPDSAFASPSDLQPAVRPGLLATPQQAQPAQAPQQPQVNRLFGVPTPGNIPTQSAFIAQQLAPELLKEYAAGQNAAVRPGGYAPDANGQRTFFPAGIPGVAVPPSDPRFLGQAAQFTTQQEGIKNALQLGREQALANANYTRSTGEPAPGAPNGGFGMGQPMAAAGAAAAAPSLAPAAPSPVQRDPNAVTPQAAAFSGVPFVTDKGTTVPPPRGNQVIGPGEIQTKAQIESGQKVIDGWNANRGNIETARDRLMLSAQVFQQVEGKGLNEQKAEAANLLRGVPFPGAKSLADSIMSAKDTGAVQLAVWNSMNEALSVLKTINQGTGGRILNSEFNAFMEKGYSPDMNSGALYGALTHQLGQIYQVQNMIDDYPTAKQMAWRDAGQYQNAYLKSNPLEGFVTYAQQDVPAFKGMQPQGLPKKVRWVIQNGKLIPEQ